MFKSMSLFFSVKAQKLGSAVPKITEQSLNFPAASTRFSYNRRIEGPICLMLEDFFSFMVENSGKTLIKVTI